MQTIERAKNIMLRPKEEWQAIALEPTTPQQLYQGYVLPLAAIGPICGFIGLSIVGVDLPVVGTYRTPISLGIVQAALSFLVALLLVYIIALIIDSLAPSFQAHKDRGQALKVAAYAYTPSWLGGFFFLIPALGILSLLLALYGLYLLYLGLRLLMKPREGKAGAYSAVVVICAIVLNLLFGLLSAALIGARPDLALRAVPLDEISSEPQTDALTKLETATQQMEQAVDRMQKGSAESAEGVGDLISALNQMLGGSAESKPIGAKQLKVLLPKQLTGMTRVEVSAEQHSLLGIAAAMASGIYEDSKGGRITLTITDAGNVSGLASFAAGMVGTSETTTDTGYEKTFKSGNRKVHEKFDRQAKSGSLDMLIDDRFLITAEGYRLISTA